MNSELKIELDKVVIDLAKTDGVTGSLIVDGNGEVLSHHLLQDVDIELFGPMANVITGSSKRLIDFSNHGEIERILVESENGKALFLHLGNFHFIVLMTNNANVGMVMISSKRASQKIIDLTKDLTPIQLEEQMGKGEREVVEAEVVEEEAKPVEEVKPEPVIEEVDKEKPVKEKSTEPKPVIEEITKLKPVEEEITETIPEPVEEPLKASSEDMVERIEEKTTKPVAETIPSEETIETAVDSSIEPSEEKTPEVGIPVIKPPITFPKLEKVTEIPEDEAERVYLLLKIYESIFLAMSIGASKIMGVAPARGLTRKFLPVEDCKILLNGVDVKNNSTIDFTKIRENAEKISISEREQNFKENFGKIIAVITENYGKVMGYSAFRAMIRPEFKIINESYGSLLDDMGVKEQLHPELQDFFN